MSVHGYTKNYKLIKPRFDTDTWHDYEYDNLDTIDAVLSAIYASGDWQGFWKNNTSYKAGSVVIDRDTDTMYKVVSDHTTDGNVTFADYMFNHPEYYQLWSPNNLAQDWAIKDDGLADNQDYSAKAYAVGGVGTETNNAKYYSEQAGIQAEISAEQAAASASSATASHNSEQLALSYANQSAASASASHFEAEQSAASAALSQEQAEISKSKSEYLESFVQEKQNEINASLTEAVKASEEARKYSIDASGANIGDIFYTSRLDDELNGAVEANGYIYNTTDFSGNETVPSLLEAGKFNYISMEAYEDLLKGDPANGECFGGALWADGTYSANYTNYFKPDKNIPFSEADTWEFQTRFNYVLRGGTSGRAILGTDETADCKGFLLHVNTSGVVCLFLSTNGTGWNLTNNLSMGVTLTANKEYDLKLGFDGEKYYFAYKLIDAEEWTTSWTLANATKVFSTGNIMLGNHRYNTAALTTLWNGGLIRLPRTKILINGEVYWQGGTGRQPQKSVKVFGWDGPGATTFRVPTAEKPKRVLVAKKEATATDPSWWNWYSDGWLEQGDYIAGAAVNQYVILPHIFKNSDYTVITVSEGGTGDYLYSGVGATPKEQSGFTFWHRFNGRYVAYGYAEVPTEKDYQFQNIEVHRAMVQVATGHTDQSLITATSVLPRMNRLESRFQIVQSLPDNPDPETFYFIIKGE